MSEAPAIRTARGDDRSQLLGLWLSLIEHHQRLDPDYPTLPGIRSVLEREIERGLRAESCHLGVAEWTSNFGCELVGFVFAEINTPSLAEAPSEGWVHEIHVEPAWRRRGVASALLAGVQDFFERGRVESVSVRVETGNAEGILFWQRHGFLERARVLSRGKAGDPK